MFVGVVVVVVVVSGIQQRPSKYIADPSQVPSLPAKIILKIIRGF